MTQDYNLSHSPTRDAAKEIRRWSPQHINFPEGTFPKAMCIPDPNGEWVSYSDHLKALSDSQKPLVAMIERLLARARHAPHAPGMGQRGDCETCDAVEDAEKLLQQLRDSLEHP